MTTGLVPAPYTRTAALDGSELRWPTTATIAGSADKCSATRTAVFSLPESSTVVSLRDAPATPPPPRPPPFAFFLAFTTLAAPWLDAPRRSGNGASKAIAVPGFGGH